jgi:hypothetical protein
MKHDHPFTDDAQGRIALHLLVVGGLAAWQRGGGFAPDDPKAEPGRASDLTAAQWCRLLLSCMSPLQAAAVVLRVMHGVKDQRGAEWMGYDGRGAVFMQWKGAVSLLRQSPTAKRMLADLETHGIPRNRRSSSSRRRLKGLEVVADEAAERHLRSIRSAIGLDRQFSQPIRGRTPPQDTPS